MLTAHSKSQLAIQHAHKVRDAAPDTYVFWVHASTRARFEEAYRGIAEKLQLLNHQDPKVDVLRLVSNWLSDETNGRWCMLIDNADDIDTFFPLPRVGQDEAVEGPSTPLMDYLPQSRNGSILITSRSRDAASRLAGGYHNIREVLAMDESQGLALLLNKLSTVPANQSDAVELVRILDHMPLAITQAAAYINRRARMTISSYIREFRANDERRESLLHCDAGDLRRDRTAANSVVTTWQLSFERIRHERPSAADLLSLMSFFNPQEIPEKTLRNYGKDSARAETGEDASKANSSFDEDLDVLYEYSLVTILPDKDACEMHALVQFCTRVWLSSFGRVEPWRDCFIQLLAQEFPHGMYETWEECQRLLPHIEPLFNIEPVCEKTAKAWTELLTHAACYLCLKGSYEVAQAVAQNAVTTRERIFGPDDGRTLKSVIILSTVLCGRGEFNEAEKLDRQVLAMTRKTLGEHHPETLLSMSNLISVLNRQEKYDEAEKLAWRVLPIMEEVLGEQDPDMLASIGNISLVLQAQEKYGEAEKLMRRTLAGMERVLGEQHPDTIMSVWSLAYLLCKLKRYEEAKPLYQRAHKGYLQTLGSQHPYTISCGECFSEMQQEARQAVSAVRTRKEHGRYSLIARAVRRLSKRLPRRD